MASTLSVLPRSVFTRPGVQVVSKTWIAQPTGSLWQTRQLSVSARIAFQNDQQSTTSKGSPFDSTRLVYLSRAKEQEGQEGVLTLTLNRPNAANAISTTLLSQLQEALAYLRFPGISNDNNAGGQKASAETDQSSPVRTLIIRSAAPKIFCAGADLKERATMTIPQVDAFLSSLRSAFSAIERLPCPVIAALDGLAMGGGLELALCADIRVAGPSATRLGLTEAKLGIIPGAGGTQRMSRLLGPSKAKDLIFSGRLLNAEQAYDLGLVDHFAATADASAQGEEAYGKALELAAEMSQNGPLALRAAKLAIDKGSQMDIETALDFERECYERLFGTEDRLEGLRAFKEKRKPKYIGR